MPYYDVGIVGLGTMGENLALNIKDKGFAVAVYNRTAERTKAFIERHKDKNFFGAFSLGEFFRALDRPRRVIILVKAGRAVDEVIEGMAPLLMEGDILADLGNSHFADTERRMRALSEKRVFFMGVGISGGWEGALKGPCIMAGGPKEGYERFEEVFEKIAAKVEGEPCSSYVGPLGAGHYVKMVHNGIEYAILQLIAEAYDFLRRGLGMSVDKAASVFKAWNDGPLSSYLTEATYKVLGVADPETGLPLVELILDRAEQKGTGKWAVQEAVELGVPTPTIDASVAARNISALKEERAEAARAFRQVPRESALNKDEAIGSLQDALLCSISISYAQGFSLLKAASEARGYALNLADIARIWRGGCIIRSKLMHYAMEAFRKRPGLSNLILDEWFSSVLTRSEGGWRKAVQAARAMGLPCPGMSSALDYFDSYRREVLPANLIQALRDYFGAHGFQRVDKPGVFHGEWR